MARNDVRSDFPPSYQQATSSSHLEVPGSRKNGIPAEYRRSMEDEAREVPPGWVRTFDPVQQHHYYVETKDPPRSIWHHPYDDEQYLNTLSGEERERLEEEKFAAGKNPSKADITAAHTDDEDDDQDRDVQDHQDKDHDKGHMRSFGRKFKDKVTGMTHEQRKEERKRREEQEQKMYERHRFIREAMSRAAQTGHPQLLGKDGDGREVYIEPPGWKSPFAGYAQGGYGVDPYRNGVYTTPSAKYIRPANPYMRQKGYNYGGPLGLPFAGGIAPLGLSGGL